tara:strand:+ start:51 stop:695 length:645 start_codon:yes stop_codon:yes gene_type:complete
MEEDISIIDNKVKNEKIKNFFIVNKKKIIFTIIFLVFVIITFFLYQEFKERKNIKVSNKYNQLIVENSKGDKQKIIEGLKVIIYEKNSTYSPLSLYFLIDNNLINDPNIINEYFDVLIEDTPLENEIRNLIIYKKALFNADDIDENDLLKILNPLINSDSVWKSHALNLAAEFFYSKGEKQKARDFFQKIILLKNSNSDIKIQAQKRLNRDLSD